MSTVGDPPCQPPQSPHRPHWGDREGLPLRDVRFRFMCRILLCPILYQKNSIFILLVIEVIVLVMYVLILLARGSVC